MRPRAGAVLVRLATKELVASFNTEHAASGGLSQNSQIRAPKTLMQGAMEWAGNEIPTRMAKRD